MCSPQGMCFIFANKREDGMSCLLSPHPGGMQRDSCFIHPTDIKDLRFNSSAAYLRDFSITELLGIDNWLWLEHDECFCVR